MKKSNPFRDSIHASFEQGKKMKEFRCQSVGALRVMAADHDGDEVQECLNTAVAIDALRGIK